jgi:hypothetical protein
MNVKLGWVAAAGALVVAVGYSLGFRDDRVDYNTEIKPLLNKHCLSCHGGVKKAGGLSLLFREEALANTKSGQPAILPGDAAHSEFIDRLTSRDPEERMPLKAEPLKREEIDLLTRWIDQGLPWDDHWAYRKPQRPEVPGKGLFASFTDWFSGKEAKNDLDFFVEKRLADEGLKPAPEADRRSLIRRVSLDLTGLPPTPAQLSRYENAANWHEAYAELVDSLLASPAFGERWASVWLDLARYADSRGYQKDNARSIWRYRDWVIRAFNADMPFDRFTVEQLAGDLLKNPSESQLIATAFHRNTMNNDETGTVDEEFRVAALLDRVNTTWEAWQGTSFGCVQCHSHPYDPFRHEEYYKFLAFFNNTRDEDTQDEAPNLREFSPADAPKLDSLGRFLNRVTTPANAAGWMRFVRVLEPRFHAHYADRYQNGALVGDRQIGLRHGGSCRLPSLKLDGKTQFAMAFASPFPGGTLELRQDSPTGPLLASVPVHSTAGVSKPAANFIPVSTEIEPVRLRPATGRHDVYLVGRNPALKPQEEVIKIVWFALLEDFPGKNDPEAAQAERQFWHLVGAKTANTPIMQASHPDYRRPTHVFVRGNWLSKGKEVQPDVPHSLPPLGQRRRDRLGLAQWLVSPDNPLTARVAVNRFWEQLFGYGLVETLEDFGTAGAKPSHPELLDYLAVRFAQDWHWSVKSLLRYIVLSNTYRQTSKVDASLLAKDPQNRLLARGPRLRLNAEMIRDQALAVSGLLSRKMYGPPVMPYQPEGIWQAVNSNLFYKQSTGEDQYRRAVYTFARRTGPYPSMVTFDAGSREVCLSRRIRTNTPLQALTLLNDPVFVEAAAHLARLGAGEKTVTAQIATVYERAIGREISPEKKEKLLRFYDVALTKFRSKKGVTSPEEAALTMVASAVLNTDEFVTKP